MEDKQRNELLEIYRLHAELADRVSQRREGANRLYVSLLLALVVLLAALFRFGKGDVPGDIVGAIVGIVGVALSVSWLLVIRSYRQLNTGKLKTLQELETQLEYPFFKREWQVLGEGEDRRRYWRLTQTEAVLPWTFFVLFLCVLVGTAWMAIMERGLGDRMLPSHIEQYDPSSAALSRRLGTECSMAKL